MTSREIKDGGPAFPHTRVMADTSGRLESGLSIRDYFAAHVLMGFLSHTSREFVDDPDGAERERTCKARSAYRYADALLKARSEKEE